MSKKKDEKSKDEGRTAEAAAPVAETKADVKAEAKAKPEPQLTFSRFFAHTGKPEHHKAGMVAWLGKRGGTSGRRTAKSWTDLFAKY